MTALTCFKIIGYLASDAQNNFLMTLNMTLNVSILWRQHWNIEDTDLFLIPIPQ